MNPHHKAVLTKEVVSLLDPRVGESYFDGTAGYGGHASVIQAYLGDGSMILVDRDQAAIESLEGRFGKRAEIVPGTYLEAATELLEAGRTVDMILLDLGVSSPQLETPDRGFSFKHHSALDMRMDQTQAKTVATIVNDYSVERLADIIGRYGEEHRAKSVARAIMAGRPFTDTAQLAEVIRKVTGYSGHVDGATRTFQALRIEVNDELKLLEDGLPELVKLLSPGGRIAVISFHSLEDRIVKDYFEIESRDCVCPPEQPICTCNHQATLVKLTRKPLQGGTLDPHNPRARSAKLRAARKLNQNQKEAKV